MSRRKKHAGGRPDEGKGGARYLLNLPPDLLDAARAAAAIRGIKLAEWWRLAGMAALPAGFAGKINRPRSGRPV